MSEPQSQEEAKGGAAGAPPDAISGVLGADNVLLAANGAQLGTYEITSSWKMPTGGHIGWVCALVGGIAYLGRGSVKIGAGYTGLTKEARSKKHMEMLQKKAEEQTATEMVELAAEHGISLPPDIGETACRALRRHVVELLETADPAGFQEYGRIKYKGTDSPSLEQRRRAYAFAFQCLLAKCYNVPNG